MAEQHGLRKTASRNSKLASNGRLDGHATAAANVMNMKCPTERRVALCAAAMTLWRRRVASDATVAKFARYIDRCARLDARERLELVEVLTRTEEGNEVMTMFEEMHAMGGRPRA
jgi:hypothetical protein